MKHTAFRSSLIAVLWVINCSCFADTYKGKVVEYNKDSGLRDVLVTVKRIDGREIVSGRTNNNGEYDLQASNTEYDFHVTYDAPDRSSFAPAGREFLKRVAPTMQLDVIGLIDKRGGSRDSAEQETHARNTRGYVRAGGSAETARAAVSDALARYGAGYRDVGDRLGLSRAFQERGLQLPQ